MQFVLISRHTDGSVVPEHQRAQNLKDMGEWLGLISAKIAIPIRGGKSVTAGGTEEYRGDVGGIIIFEADNLDQAVAIAKKSPGLKFGFTHEVLPEISMEQAATAEVRKS